jgi:hypothetical protein
MWASILTRRGLILYPMRAYIRGLGEVPAGARYIPAEFTHIDYNVDAVVLMAAVILGCGVLRQKSRCLEAKISRD